MLDYQRVVAEIDLDALGNNMRCIRKIVAPNSKIMAIVKADGYGHGAFETAKVALYNGADCLGVAILDEAIQLRSFNIHVPILILGYTPSFKIDDAVKANITQTVFSLEMAEAISASAAKQRKIADIHIKIDTGMGRLGFLPNNETISCILNIIGMPNINITGIYTHFACSDNEDKSYTFEQNEKFKWVIEELEKHKVYIPNKHVANSAAIVDIKNFNYDYVRAGIVLYGLSPSEHINLSNLDLKPAMSLKTHVSYIKELPAGSSIGYGRSFETKRKSIIATVPVGYADGFGRSLSNCGYVIVGGEFAPIVGNICMDQFMIDVTDIKNISANDEIILIGKQGDKIITADEIAKKMNTINYEVVCMIGKRVPRVYIKNGEYLKTVNYL